MMKSRILFPIVILLLLTLIMVSCGRFLHPLQPRTNKNDLGAPIRDIYVITIDLNKIRLGWKFPLNDEDRPARIKVLRRTIDETEGWEEIAKKYLEPKEGRDYFDSRDWDESSHYEWLDDLTGETGSYKYVYSIYCVMTDYGTYLEYYQRATYRDGNVVRRHPSQLVWFDSTNRYDDDPIIYISKDVDHPDITGGSPTIAALTFDVGFIYKRGEDKVVKATLYLTTTERAMQAVTGNVMLGFFASDWSGDADYNTASARAVYSAPGVLVPNSPATENTGFEIDVTGIVRQKWAANTSLGNYGFALESDTTGDFFTFYGCDDDSPELEVKYYAD